MQVTFKECCRSMLVALATEPHARTSMLRGLAAAGEVDVLRTLLDEKLIEPPKHFDKYLHSALLGLLAQDPQTAIADATKALVRDWLCFFGGNEHGLDLALFDITDGKITRQLLALGANPNALVPGHRRTPIGEAYERERGDALLAQIDLCLRNNALPMYDAETTIFSHLFRQSEEYFEIAAAERMRKLGPWPQSWRQALGQALLQRLGEEPKASAAMAYEEAHWCGLIAFCDLSAEDWAMVLREIPIGRHLASEEDLRYGNRLAALQNIIAGGVDPNQHFATLKDGTPCPLLLAAAEADNDELVEYVLQMGADPTKAVARGTNTVTAEQLAPENGRAAALLASWRARHAIRNAQTAGRRLAP